MKGCLVPFVVNSITLMVVAGFFPGFHLEGIGAIVIASIILTGMNFFLRPLFIILTLPITLFTFGFFLFVINAFLLMLTSALMGDAFVISGFGMALLAAIIIAILNVLIEHFIIKPFAR